MKPPRDAKRDATKSGNADGWESLVASKKTPPATGKDKAPATGQSKPPAQGKGKAPASGKGKSKSAAAAPDPVPDEATPSPPPSLCERLTAITQDRQWQVAMIRRLLMMLIGLLLLALGLVVREWLRPPPPLLLPALHERPFFFWDGVATDPPAREVHETLVAYLGMPDLLPQDVMMQLNDSAAMPFIHDLAEDRLYFVMPREAFSGRQEYDRLTMDPSAVRTARRDDENRLVLGKYEMPDADVVFFSFPASDLIIHPERAITIDYPEHRYELPLRDLVACHFNRSIFGGFYVNRVREHPERFRDAFVNAGAFVAYPGEPSLRRLVNELTDYDDTAEQRVQALLHFVTRRIRLDYPAAKPAGQVQKAQETLLRGRGGYLDRAILLASLLEQTEVHYLLVFNDSGQAAVLVAGDFPTRGGALAIKINRATYHLADTTSRSFLIGSAATSRFQRGRLTHIQRPGINSRVYDIETGQAIDDLLVPR